MGTGGVGWCWSPWKWFRLCWGHHVTWRKATASHHPASDKWGSVGWVPDKEQGDHNVGKAQTQGIWVQGQQPRGAQVSNQLASGRPVNKGKVLSLSWAQIPVRVIAPDARVLEIEVVWWGMGRETCYWSSPGYGSLVTSKDTWVKLL